MLNRYIASLRCYMPAIPFPLPYEGEEEEVAKKAEEEAAKKAEEDKKKAEKKTFTQDEVNAMLADDRRKHQAQLQKQIQQLEALQKAKGLTEKEKTDLATRIEELQAGMLTKDQLAAKEREKLENHHKTTVQTLTAERDTWQNRFVRSTINTAILGEAARAKAFDADALIAILGPNTRLAEDVDEDGKPTEGFTPKVKFSDTDTEGKAVTLDLTIPQVVKRMMEIPRYGYLFESTAAGGLGAGSGAGKGSGVVDIGKMTPQQYREHRKKIGMSRKPN